MLNIKEIAKRCGVSTATISRVLNSSPLVSEKTRKHVKEIMEQEAYVPNAFARGLGLNSMKTIGMLCTNVSDQYYATAVSLVEFHLRQNNFDILLCCTGKSIADKRSMTEKLILKRVDALILVGSAFQEISDNSHIVKAAQQVPVIMINAFLDIPNVYCVLCNEKKAMRENVTLLSNHGYRNILYLYDADTYSGRQKLAGFYEGLNDNNIQVRDEWVVQTENDIDIAQNIVTAIFKNYPEITAILASEDILAVGALQSLSKTDFKIPVIGFDNSKYSKCTTPTLTSVDNRLNDLCPMAVNLLIRHFNGDEPPRKTLLPAELIVRSSFPLIRN